MMTRRALLIEILNNVNMMLRMLSDHWTANMPMEGCEGAWELERERAQVMRAWIQEMDAGKQSKDPEVWEKRVGVLNNGLVITETFMRRMCHNGVLDEPYQECRGVWERDAKAREMIMQWIAEIKSGQAEVQGYDMGQNKGQDGGRDADGMGDAYGGEPQAGTVEAEGRITGGDRRLHSGEGVPGEMEGVEVGGAHRFQHKGQANGEQVSLL